MFPISIIFFCLLQLTLTNPLATLTTNSPWLHPNGLFIVKNLIWNPAGYSPLSITINESKEWNISSIINCTNLSANRVFKATFQYTVPIRMRVDSGSTLFLDIDLSSYIHEQVSFMASIIVRFFNSSKLVIFNFAMNNISRNCTKDLFEINSVKYYYGIDSSSSSNNIWIQQETSKFQYKNKIDIMLLLRKFSKYQQNQLPGNNSIESLSYDFVFNTSKQNLLCEVRFNTNVTTPKKCKSQTFSIAINNSRLIHEDLRNNFNQFGNIWIFNDNSPLLDYIFDYNFLVPNGQTSQCLQEKSFTYLLWSKQSQVSNPDLFNFPINNTLKTIISTFSIEMDATRGPVKAQICFVILLRNDYNPSTNSFLNTTGSDAEIKICHWSSINYQIPVDSWKNIENSEYAYKNFSNPKQYLFIDQNTKTFSQRKQFNKPSLNLSKFVENISELSNHYIIAVKRGFRVFCGRVNFVITAQKIEISNNTIHSTNNSSNLSNISNVSNLSNVSNVQNISNLSNTLNSYTRTINTIQSFSFSQTTKTAVSSAVSVPNVGMLLRLAQLLNTLDDLSYFIYHSTSYDAAFKNISDLSWGWTHSKWLPPSLIQNFININLSSGYEPGWIPYIQPVARFRIKSERMAFLDNCKGFLFYTVPSSLLLFVVLWKLYWRFKDYKAAAVLTSFSSWAYLAVSLICDNGQYFSFRGFEQLRSLQPMGGLFLISQILAIFILFFAVFCSFGLLLLAHSIASNVFKPPTLIRDLSSYKFFLIWSASRFFAGYVHAAIDQPFIRISLLIGLQFILIVSIFLSWPCTRFRTPHIALVIGQLTRLILYSFICLQVVFPQLVEDNQVYLGGISSFLVQVVFVATASQVILTILVGIATKPKDSDFKKNYFSKQKKKITVKQKVVENGKSQIKIIHPCPVIEQSLFKFESASDRYKTQQELRHKLIKNPSLTSSINEKLQTGNKKIKELQKRKYEIEKGKLKIQKLELKDNNKK